MKDHIYIIVKAALNHNSNFEPAKRLVAPPNLDYLVIGAGIIGLAIAMKLNIGFPAAKLARDGNKRKGNIATQLI